METNQFNHSSSRSKRSHTNLANLRLAPLSTENLSTRSSGTPTDSTFQIYHSSYIQGRSAPCTPGILGRTSSRRQLHGGLSRKLSIYDIDTPNYAAVEVSRDGVPLNALRADPGLATIPKAKSEAALLVQRRNLSNLHAHLSHHSGGTRNHKRSQTGGSAFRVTRNREDDDWLSRAALATNTMLRESKGQVWHSTTGLADDASSGEDDEALAGMSASAHQRLHFADDELSPETPRYTSRWGSRFGSRAPSARNSRRGSQVDIFWTPMNAASQDDGYFGQHIAQREEIVEPDFVDVEEVEGEDVEEEIARLARERSSGFGGLVDKLVGWTLFNVDEDRETTDIEDEDNDGDRETVGASRTVMDRRVKPQTDHAQPDPEEKEDNEEEEEEEGGWHDAAWLLSLATKVLL